LDLIKPLVEELVHLSGIRFTWPLEGHRDDIGKDRGKLPNQIEEVVTVDAGQFHAVQCLAGGRAFSGREAAGVPTSHARAQVGATVRRRTCGMLVENRKQAHFTDHFPLPPVQHRFLFPVPADSDANVSDADQLHVIPLCRPV
jgi:hypothetical protein